MVIIDSQPLTVAIMASILFGESLGYVGAAGLVLGIVGLLLLEAPALAFDVNNFSFWGSGEWWMFLATQSMVIGTVMVRWVAKYSDPVMATRLHMVIGGLPLMAILILNHDPALSSFNELTTSDVLALLYSSIFGLQSASVSYSTMPQELDKTQFPDLYDSNGITGDGCIQNGEESLYLDEISKC